MPLTEEQRVVIRHHMGYLQVADAYTFVLGSPASVETTFIVEGAMNRVLEAAIPLVEQHLDILRGIECQMIGNLENLAATAIGDLQINGREQAELRKQYDYWVASLANILGCPRNPFDKRLTTTGGINVRVAG